MNPGLIKNYYAGAALPANRIAKVGADDGHVLLAAAATDLIIGASTNVGADNAEERIDVVLGGIADVEFGGTVARGQKVTADASGKAVVAAGGEGLKSAVVAGANASGGAQTVTVTGIATTDTLVSVTRVVGAGTDVTDVSDVTSKFTITDADEITQADTDMSSDKLVVTYRDASAVVHTVGIALNSAVSGDIAPVLVVPGEL